MTRTDVHRPAALVTEDYEYFGCYDLGDSETPPWFSWSGRLFDGARIPPCATEDGGLGACGHCGKSGLRYGAVMIHIPTGKSLYVGETCLANRFERATADFHAMRKSAQLDRKAAGIRAEWENYQAEVAGIHDDEELLPVNWDALHASTNSFVQDVLAKGQRYGSISDRQLVAIVKAVARDAERASEPEEIRVPAPEGRTEFTGEVVGLKVHEGDFGPTLKMTVKVGTDNGVWLAWLTVPSSINPNRGDTVTVTATLTRSDRDESFAFGKRPSKASIVKGES